MKTQTKKKMVEVIDFDPVKMMRDIRDKLTKEIAGMTYEQEKEYLKKLLAKG
jgi:arginine decarboxylase-like protein